MILSIFDKFNQSFMEGKGLLIMVIIVFSSFSFVVGFFTGKKLSIKEANTIASTDNPPNVQENTAKNRQQSTPNIFSNVTSSNTADVSADKVESVENLNKKAIEEQNTDIVEDKTQVKPDSQTPKENVPVKATPQVIHQPEKTVTKSSAKEKKPHEMAAAETKQSEKLKKPIPVVITKEIPVKPRPQTDEIKVLSKQTHGGGKEHYIIQVGAFKSLGEAMRLQEELKQKGFESDISKHAIKDGMMLYKVRLDYANSKDDAAATLSRLNKKGIKGFIKGETR
ncbi:MAG: SPOR domain-containing protein [Nitrospirae bacterium]|nr:SPOR domain-containing protein [Nitrospirota bacterium]